MTCPCGLTRLEFKLWDSRALFQGSRWNIEIAAMAFALLPAFCDIPSLWHLSANQSDGQLTWGEQRRGPPSQFVLVCLVKEVEWHLEIWRHTALLRWCPAVYLVVKSRDGNIVRLTEFIGLEPLWPYLLPDSDKTCVLSFSILFFLF